MKEDFEGREQDELGQREEDDDAEHLAEVEGAPRGRCHEHGAPHPHLPLAEKCAAQGLDVSVGKAFFKANGRSNAHNETVGEIRVLRDNSTNKIVGVTMVGAIVTELIGAARALIGSTEKITEVSFPHPTVSEVLKESVEDAFGMSLHNPPH